MKNYLFLLLLLFVIFSCDKDDKSDNTSPVAEFSVDPLVGGIFTEFTFNAELCSDAEDETTDLLVRWDFESDQTWDTEWSTNKTSSHIFQLAGTFNVTLEVKDSQGAVSSKTKSIVVDADANNPPFADFTVSPLQGDVFTNFMFDASQSSDIEDQLESLQVRWDFENDEVWDTDWSATKTIEHLFDTAGTYEVVLEVKDQEGLISSTTKTVVVEAPESFEILKNYLISNDLDLNSIIKNADNTKYIVSAPESANLSEFLYYYHIIDVRDIDDYNAGHIEGAIHSTVPNLLTEAANASKRILVVDEAGQTSSYLVTLLRLSGYDDAQTLRFGMAMWHDDFADVWDNNIGDIADGHANWDYSTQLSNSTHLAPELTSNQTDGHSILADRVSTVLNEGFKGKSANEVLNDPDNYFINTYMSETDFLGFGHIASSYRINPLLLEDESMLYLDPSKPIVTVAYIGMTEALITAYLRVLGYDAYSLEYGMNGLYHSCPAWVNVQWGVTQMPKNLPYVTE